VSIVRLLVQTNDTIQELGLFSVNRTLLGQQTHLQNVGFVVYKVCILNDC
jgi:hypothetical protein